MGREHLVLHPLMIAHPRDEIRKYIKQKIMFKILYLSSNHALDK